MVVVIPVLVLMFRGIHKHYLRVAKQLSTEGLERLNEIRNTVIVPISGIHRGVINALQVRQIDLAQRRQSRIRGFRRRRDTESAGEMGAMGFRC